jgi:hypothetical protein
MAMTKEQELLKLRLGEDWEGIVKKVEARDRLTTKMGKVGVAGAVVGIVFLIMGFHWYVIVYPGIILVWGGMAAVFLGGVLHQRILPALNEVDEVKSLLRMRDSGIIKFKDEDISEINIVKNHTGKWVVNKNKARRIE